jgi:hypothetical protein
MTRTVKPPVTYVSDDSDPKQTRIEKLQLDCATLARAPSHHGSTQQWPLLHREDYLQGSEILAVISPSRLRVGVQIQVTSTSPDPMMTVRLGQMAALSPRRLAEQPLRDRGFQVAGSALASRHHDDSCKNRNAA